MTQKKALGKGLSALLAGTTLNKGIGKSNSIQEIPISQINVNPFQPRQNFDIDKLEKLCNSIKNYGVIQPVTLRKVQPNKYDLISGERRLQASKMAKLTHIPGYIREANDSKMLEMSLVENIERENLDPIEIALSYQRLITECNFTNQIISNKLGRDRTTISNYLRLLKLPPEIQVALREGLLSMGHARAIINICDTGLQLQISKEIIEKNLSVRDVENKVRLLMAKTEVKPQLKNTLPQMQYSAIQKISKQLSNDLKTKVKISTNQIGKGEIRIKFANNNDLERISLLLKKQKND